MEYNTKVNTSEVYPTKSKSSPIFVGIYVVAMTAALFGISKHFPSDWYHPTNIMLLLGTVSGMIQVFNLYVFIVPMAAVTLIIAVFKRPDRVFARLPILLLPLGPAVLTTLWGAYRWRYYEKSLLTLSTSGWTSSVYSELNYIYILHFLTLGIIVALSKGWHNARVFGLCILAAEFMLTFGTVFVALMATSGAWM